MAEPSDLAVACEAAVARCSTPDALGGHGLDLIGARQRFGDGEVVDGVLRTSVRNNALIEMSAIALLERIRAAVEGPVAILKGLELAARYPDPRTRPFVDVDLLVPDAVAVHETLLAAGFNIASEIHPRYEDHHHLPALWWPGFTVPVEVHRALGAQRWARVPDAETLLGRAQASATGIPGVTTLDPVDHAVFVANHAWRSAPLGRLGHLVDVQVLRLAARDQYPDADERLRATAAAWRLERMWKLTVAAIEGELLQSRRLTPALWMVRHRLRHLRDTPTAGSREAYLYSGWIRPLRSWGRRSGGTSS